jgi:hypothetical protein
MQLGRSIRGRNPDDVVVANAVRIAVQQINPCGHLKGVDDDRAIVEQHVCIETDRVVAERISGLVVTAASDIPDHMVIARCFDLDSCLGADGY